MLLTNWKLNNVLFHTWYVSPNCYISPISFVLIFRVCKLYLVRCSKSNLEVQNKTDYVEEVEASETFLIFKNYTLSFQVKNE